MRRRLVLLGCFIGMAVSISATLTFPIGLYLAPVTTEFGWSRAQFAATISFVSLGYLMMLPIAGHLVDRIGAVRSIAIGMVLSNACCAAIGLTRSFPAFVAMASLASMSGALALYPAFFGIARGWFDRNLGLALAIASAGVSAGIAGFSRLITVTIAHDGWRRAFEVNGAVALGLGLLSLALLVRENPGPMPRAEQRAAGSAPTTGGVPLGTALRSRDFWCFAGAFMLAIFAGSGPQVHLPALLADKGVPPGTVASVLGVLALGSVAGRLVSGLLLDRMSFKIVAAIFFLGQALGIVLLSRGADHALVAALLMGGAVGAEVDLVGFVAARRFARRAYSRILGVVLAIAQSALIVSPVATGLIFDRYRSYDPILLSYPLLSVLAVVLICCATLRRPEDRMPDGRAA